MSSINPFLQLGQSRNVKELQTSYSMPGLPEGSQSMCNPFSMFWLCFRSFPRWMSLSTVSMVRCVEVSWSDSQTASWLFKKKQSKTTTSEICGSTTDQTFLSIWHSLLPSVVNKTPNPNVTKLLKRYSFTCSKGLIWLKSLPSPKPLLSMNHFIVWRG